MLTPETILKNPQLYGFLTLYFQEELSDPLFQRDHAEELAANPRWTYARYIAACLPFHAELTNLMRECEEGTRVWREGRCGYPAM